jgi:hypothetical protein
MTIARVHLVDPLVSRWYHCITRCVRRAKLLGEKKDRKEWILQAERLADLPGHARPMLTSITCGRYRLES